MRQVSFSFFTRTDFLLNKLSVWSELIIAFHSTQCVLAISGQSCKLCTIAVLASRVVLTRKLLRVIFKKWLQRVYKKIWHRRWWLFCYFELTFLLSVQALVALEPYYYQDFWWSHLSVVVISNHLPFIFRSHSRDQMLE